MVPRLVPDDQLVTANAVSGQVANVSRLTGSALGGVLAAFGGIIAVTAVDATSFLASAALLYWGRVFGAVSALEGVTVLAGTLGSGYLSRIAGIIPVLAVQGAGYVVAGLAMLVWLKEEPGEPAGASAQRQGGPALVAAEG
jgi:hypothetical protein